MTTKQMERPGNATPELVASDVMPEVDSDFPLLTALGLTQSDFAALRTNGFVVCEQRRARQVHRLHFRRDGRQIARSIGNAAQAELVKTELNKLQGPVRRERRLHALAAASRQLLRQHKTVLEPLLLQYGLKFHGRAIRRPHRLLSKKEI